MKILVSESVDKRTQNIQTISYESVLLGMKYDNKWVEVIDAFIPSKLVRMYFDIDGYDIDDPLEIALQELNTIFNCSNEDWAISCGNRGNKISYHILSKKYCISIENLRKITKKINKKYSFFDYLLLCISMLSDKEYLYCEDPSI